MLVSTSCLIRPVSITVFEVMSGNWSSGEPFSVHVIFIISTLEAGEVAVNSALPPIYTAVSPLNVIPVMKKKKYLLLCKSITYYLILVDLLQHTLGALNRLETLSPGFNYYFVGNEVI